MGRKHLQLVTNPGESKDSPDAVSQRRYIESLFTKYRSSLESYLTGLMRNDEDAQELLQETYVRLLQQENLDHLETNARAYLFKVATNLVRDRFRREKARQREWHEPFEESEHSDDSAAPAARLEWSTALDQLKTSIAELNPRCRRVFILHRFRHKSYAEIALLLGVTTRTVERDMSAAMAHCRKRLEGIL